MNPNRFRSDFSKLMEIESYLNLYHSFEINGHDLLLSLKKNLKLRYFISFTILTAFTIPSNEFCIKV